jgi:NADPH-dependent curcumin reductase CurA
MSLLNKQVLLVNRPEGWVEESNFEIVETPVPTLNVGEILVQNHYLSLDPYMRGRIGTAKSYAKGVEIGEVMVGGTVGEVVESRNPDFKPGDKVNGSFGWQQYGVSNGKGLNRISDDSPVPIQAYLGVAGMPGITAWYGLNIIGQPKAGETLVVAAASGAVGSVVGQLAKLLGLRVVGIAGGQAKCEYVVEVLGFDACLDYREGNLYSKLKQAVPNGIDIYFENVGGEILDTVLLFMNPFGRIPLCGLISEYNTASDGLKHLRSLLVNRIKLEGFIISDHLDIWPKAQAALVKLVADGKIKYRESVVEGLENAPRAFIGLLKGENFGKQLVKL